MNFCNNSTIYELYSNVNQEGIENKKTLYKFFCPILITACVVSVILNALLVFIGYTRTVNKSPVLILSLNLATTDCFASLLVGIGLLVNSYLPVVFNVNLQDFQCILLVIEIFRLASLIASAMHLLSLALVHYKGIVKPLHYRSAIFCSTHRTKSIHVLSIFCWVIPVIFFFVYFTSIPCQGFLSSKCMNMHFMLTRRFRFIIVISFFIPLVIMLFLYVRIFGIIKNHQNNRNSLPGSVRSLPTNHSIKQQTSMETKATEIKEDSSTAVEKGKEKASQKDGEKAAKKPLMANLKWCSKCSCVEGTASSSQSRQTESTEPTTSISQQVNVNGNSQVKKISISSRRSANLRSMSTGNTKYRFQPQVHGHAKALVTTLLILGTYLFCWIPAVIFFGLTCFQCLIPLNELSYTTRVVTAFIINALVIIKAIVDPFIYTYRMKEMKVALNRYRNGHGVSYRSSTNQRSGTMTTFRSTSPSSVRHRCMVAETSMMVTK